MGTLLAFTTAAVSVLILRYVPPDEVPLPSSLQHFIESMSSGDIQEVDCNKIKDLAGSQSNSQNLDEKGIALLGHPLIEKGVAQGDTWKHAFQHCDFNLY